MTYFEPFPQTPERRFNTLLARIQARLGKLESRTAVMDTGALVNTRSGTVTAVTAGQPTVQFAGQAGVSGPWPVLGGYSPTVGDTVLCAPLGLGYVVLGTYA